MRTGKALPSFEKYFDQFIVPALSGGACTSIYMNVNDITADAALIKLGKKFGHSQIGSRK